jgi:hypothetical protein
MSASPVDGFEQAGRQARVRIAKARIASELARNDRLNNGSLLVDCVELAAQRGGRGGEAPIELLVDLADDRGDDCGALELASMILFLRPVEAALIDRDDGDRDRSEDQERQAELAEKGFHALGEREPRDHCLDH